MKIHLHLDIETYSDVDIKKGVHRYVESPALEILVVAFAINDEPVQIYDWNCVPEYFFEMLTDPSIIKWAHNAAFERLVFKALGYDVPVNQWRCTMILAAYCGLPMKLETLSTVLNLGSEGKLTTGKALINYWCMPVKATKTNGGRTRNLKKHNPEKWLELGTYCGYDVRAERKVFKVLSPSPISEAEWSAWELDQLINDRGVRVDVTFVQQVLAINDIEMERLKDRCRKITNVSNPNSLAQLRQWLGLKTGERIDSLTKEDVNTLLGTTTDSAVREVLEIRQQLGKTSIRKYVTMLECIGEDDRARGLFQHYGANRTGRWAGRRVQLQNLPKNEMKDLDQARKLTRQGDHTSLTMLYTISDVLSQLIRTAMVPRPGYKFIPGDFSAIEARVLAWLAGEKWRLDVFETHGKIYEASASRMFSVPLESISYLDANGIVQKGPNYSYRAKGKVAELALGYQGGVNAIIRMGGERMGLNEIEMEMIVEKWRHANGKIVALWKQFQNAAIDAVRFQKTVRHVSTGIVFKAGKTTLRILLPSRRELFYWKPHLVPGKYGDSLKYWGVDPDTKKWGVVSTYGGKLIENVTQAIARDLLLYAMVNVEAAGIPIVMHVHDELVPEVPEAQAEALLKKTLQIMSVGPDWSKGLPLGAEGYVCDYYKKD